MRHFVKIKHSLATGGMASLVLCASLGTHPSYAQDAQDPCGGDPYCQEQMQVQAQQQAAQIAAEEAARQAALQSQQGGQGGDPYAGAQTTTGEPITPSYRPSPSYYRSWTAFNIEPDVSLPDYVRQPCARTPEEAMARFAGAMNSGNLNRALEFYDWEGLDSDGAYSLADQISALGPGVWEVESIVASAGTNLKQFEGLPAVRWRAAQTVTTFTWRENLDCFFLTTPQGIATRAAAPARYREAYDAVMGSDTPGDDSYPVGADGYALPATAPRSPSPAPTRQDPAIAPGPEQPQAPRQEQQGNLTIIYD